MTALLAHAAPISYKFPLPIWLYVLAGGAAVLLSAPAAALAVNDRAPEERSGPDLYASVRWLGTPLVVLATLLLIVALAGGLFSTTDESKEFFENPMTVLTWVDFWVGLGIVSWLVPKLLPIGRTLAAVPVLGRPCVMCCPSRCTTRSFPSPANSIANGRFSIRSICSRPGTIIRKQRPLWIQERPADRIDGENARDQE